MFSFLLGVLSNGLGPAGRHLRNEYSRDKERKGTFNQNAGNLGRRWIQHPPETTSEDSARA